MSVLAIVAGSVVGTVLGLFFAGSILLIFENLKNDSHVD